MQIKSNTYSVQSFGCHSMIRATGYANGDVAGKFGYWVKQCAFHNTSGQLDIAISDANVCNMPAKYKELLNKARALRPHLERVGLVKPFN